MPTSYKRKLKTDHNYAPALVEDDNKQTVNEQVVNNNPGMVENDDSI